MTEKKFDKNYIIVMIALCGAIASSIGLIGNTTGIYLGPVASTLGVGKGQVSAGVSVGNVFFSIGGVLAARLIKRHNFKLVIIISAVMTALGVYLLSLTNSVLMFAGLYGAIGFFRAFTGTVVVNMVINNWFYSSTGVMTAIASGFSGIVGASLMPFLSGIIEKSGWPTAYRTTSMLIAAFYLPIVFLKVGLVPQDAGSKPYGERELKAASSEEKTEIPFRIKALLIVFAAFGGMMMSIVQHFPGIVSDYQLPAAVGASMLSIGLIANTAGKLIMGVMMDHFGTDRSIYMMSALVITGIILINFVPGKTTLLVAAALIGLVYSFAMVGTSVKCRETAGLANYSSVYSIANMAITLSYALGTTLNGYIYDVFSSYSLALKLLFVYMGIIIVCCALCTRLSAERK